MQTSFVIQQVAVLAILMAVGYTATKKNILNENISKGMTQILTNIALPALVISSFNMSYSKDTIRGVLLILAYSLGIHLFIILAAKVFFKKYPKGKSSILQFGTIYSNSAFMGLPLIFELFGQEAALYASVYMIPYQILLWTYGESQLAKQKTDSPIKKIMTTPTLIAVLLGIIVFGLRIEMPYVVNKPISLLSSLTSPLSMLILGEKITKLKLKEIIGDKDIYYGCFVKLIATPIIALLILRGIKAPEIMVNIVVTMQSLPAAVLLVILTQKHEGDTALATKFTVVSHMVSILTIPLISLLL